METIKITDEKVIEFLSNLKEQEETANTGMDHHANRAKLCVKRMFNILNEAYPDIDGKIIRYNSETKEITVLKGGFDGLAKKLEEEEKDSDKNK